MSENEMKWAYDYRCKEFVLKIERGMLCISFPPKDKILATGGTYVFEYSSDIPDIDGSVTTYAATYDSGSGKLLDTSRADARHIAPFVNFLKDVPGLPAHVKPGLDFLIEGIEAAVDKKKS